MKDEILIEERVKEQNCLQLQPKEKLLIVP